MSAATPATVEQVYFPQAEIVGDVGASLAALPPAWKANSPMPAALRGLREGILAHLAERADRGPLSADAPAHRA